MKQYFARNFSEPVWKNYELKMAAFWDTVSALKRRSTSTRLHDTRSQETYLLTRRRQNLKSLGITNCSFTIATTEPKLSSGSIHPFQRKKGTINTEC